MLMFVIMNQTVPAAQESARGSGFFFSMSFLDEEGNNNAQCESTDGHAKEFDHFHGGKMMVESGEGGGRCKTVVKVWRCSGCAGGDQ